MKQNKTALYCTVRYGTRQCNLFFFAFLLQLVSQTGRQAHKHCRVMTLCDLTDSIYAYKSTMLVSCERYSVRFGWLQQSIHTYMILCLMQ